jgi:hypothetical protein
LMEILTGDVEVGAGRCLQVLQVIYKITRTHCGFPQWFSSDAQVRHTLERVSVSVGAKRVRNNIIPGSCYL